MKKILIVEDEKSLANIISDALKFEGFDTSIVYRGDQALDSFYEEKPDLILLDINLPGMNGWDICKQLKSISQVPIIMVTARDSEFDEIKGLELGADDYITKPFTPKLLIIKLKKIFKLDNDTFFKIKDITFDFNTFILTTPDSINTLPRREAQLLEFFLRNQNIILSRETLLNEVWGFEFFGDERAVDTIVKRLRKKLGNYDNYIKSVRGVGYVFKTD
ncbi:MULTISPECIES: response regulator transcription factor [Cetobacterium]|jgi:DNA-binding response OmpR family regulator|uniref:Response regulator transcription factor n=1 Tax=Candidatus Cetobacterium colombiensis TaxID=3073100 RepID=A0ABU4W9V4_9FUSO|nr:response regulator transcription factor [Candidatus Cetobacterium colombiensis]MDX8336311.1 response regulator transcription factor [Candidatus Cetobacterium colombiensis]